MNNNKTNDSYCRYMSVRRYFTWNFSHNFSFNFVAASSSLLIQKTVTQVEVDG